MTQPDANQIHEFIVDYFSLDELKTLCFKLGVEFDDLGGDGRAGKARELVLFAQRQIQLKRLDEMVLQARPEAYRQKFGRFIHETTGIELIRIPAGLFNYNESHKQKFVNLAEYWIGRYQVTNAQFARFVQSTGHQTATSNYGWEGSGWHHIKDSDWRHPYGLNSSSAGKEDHPVILVSWRDAKAFCNWAGLGLPSIEQWTKAAQGWDGRIWPWGNDPPTAKHCNFNLNIGDTTPVGTYSPKGDSPFGCADMAGNVMEWTANRTGWEFAIAMGGAWFNDAQRCQCAEYGYGAQSEGHTGIGFRALEFRPDLLQSVRLL